MTGLLIAFLALAPIVSKNPAKQDTVATTNIHLAAGIRPATDRTSLGVEAGVKCEYLLFHPVIIRASANFSSCAVDGNRLPGGQNNAVEFAFEALLYRGTKRFTAYLGGGPIYSTNNFRLSRQLNDSLLAQSAVYKTEIEDKYGFRLTMGFRLAENYSFEFGFQELRPSFVFRGRSSEQGEIAIYRPSKLSTVRFTLGYIFAL